MLSQPRLPLSIQPTYTLILSYQTLYFQRDTTLEHKPHLYLERVCVDPTFRPRHSCLRSSCLWQHWHSTAETPNNTMASHHHNVVHNARPPSVIEKLHSDCRQQFRGFGGHPTFDALIDSMQHEAAAPRRAPLQTEDQYAREERAWRHRQAYRLLAAENQFMHAVWYIHNARTAHPELAHLMDFREIVEAYMGLKFDRLRHYWIRAYAEDWPMAVRNGSRARYPGWKIPNVPEAEARPPWTILCQWNALSTEDFVETMDDNWTVTCRHWLST